MSRITDFSPSDSQGDAYDDAKILLNGSWAAVPDDLHAEAEGTYMIDLVVGDRPRSFCAKNSPLIGTTDPRHVGAFCDPAASIFQHARARE